MSSDKNFGTIALLNGTSLTTAYGLVAGGWITEAIDVSALEFVTFELTYLHKTAAALLSLRPVFGDRSSADADAFGIDLDDPNGDNALTPLLKTVDVSSGYTNDVSHILHFRVDVRAASMLRLGAQIDDVTGTPTLSARYLGSGRAGGPLTTTPAVTAPA